MLLGDEAAVSNGAGGAKWQRGRSGVGEGRRIRPFVGSQALPNGLLLADGEDTFQRLVEPFRRELQLYCYRMLGSVQEAEDLVQETFLRAWRARERFEGRTTLRNWLYRIATNACLNALAKRPSRQLPDAYGAPSGRHPGGPASNVAWLEPYPDAAIEFIPDATPGPEARYELRESVELAFVAAIQQLPPRQRAVLLLRDVLGLSASETARLLNTSLLSVDGAVRRARATLESHVSSGRPNRLPSDAAQRALVERYVRAWEQPDLSEFVALLKEDAVLRMPPWLEWYVGREAIRSFFTWAWAPLGADPFRIVLTAANCQPAIAQYQRAPGRSEYRAHGLHVLSLDEDGVAAVTIFRDTRLFAAFGLPKVHPGGLAK